MNPDAEKLLATAQSLLEVDYKRVMERLVPMSPGDQVPVFVARVLAWQNDPDRSQWVYEMFRKAFAYDALRFFSTLNSFVGNCILDDSYFVIEWRKTDYLITPEGEYELQWEESGSEIKTKLTTKDDPDGRPCVMWSNTDSGLQDVKLLLEAMDIMEEREMEYHRKMEGDQAFIQEAMLVLALSDATSRLENP